MNSFSKQERESSNSSNAEQVVASNENDCAALTPPPFQLESEDISPLSGPNLATRAQADQCHIPEKGEDDSWNRFYEIFNHEFRSILHSFTNHSSPDAENTGIGVGVGEQTAQDLSQERLAELFTPSQRDKLIAFYESREIPDRLFNGDDIGSTTAQQRILMSSHILAEGTYQPGSFVQGVHARMCYHWVRIVHHYAGATTVSNNRDLMGSFDHDNNVVLGSGNTQSIHDESSHRVGTDILAIPAGTSHARREAEGHRVHRAVAFPMERYDELQPGDWLWYYNANGSGSGSHSVIFSHWVDAEPVTNGTSAYRQAICFSQGRPQNGGREHSVRFGDEYDGSTSPKIYPITSVTRVPENTNPADSVESIVGQSDRIERRSATANGRFIERVCRRAHFIRDEEHIARYVEEINSEIRGRNEQLILNLYHLTDGQRNLLRESNNTEELHQLVRLHQRLSALATNQQVLQENHESRYETLNERHESASEEINTRNEEIRANIEEQRAIIAPNEQRLEEIEEELTRLAPSTRSLDRERRQLVRQRRSLQRGSEERRVVQNRINENIAEADRLRDISRENRSRVSELRGEKRQLISASRRPNRLIARYEGQLSTNQRNLPHGSVHTGNLRNSDRNRARGRLEDIMSLAELREIIQNLQYSSEQVD